MHGDVNEVRTTVVDACEGMSEEEEFPSDLSSPFAIGTIGCSGAPTSRGISRDLWRSSLDLVGKALMNPFVLALGQGTLPKESFRAYIAEDAFFLQTFSMGYAAAIERCVPGQTAPSSLSDEVISSVSHNLQDLHSGVMEELTMHETYAASWGIDISHHKSPAPATSRYCDFLKQIISSPQETVASILAAMIPCLRLYAYIGQSLFHAFYQDRKRQNPYSEWIRTYACPEYQRLPFLAEGMLDLLCGEESLDYLLGHYRKAMQLECDFFASQPFKARSVPINLLVVDFDDTCTAKDTTSLIATAAINSTARQVSQIQEQSEEAFETVQEEGQALLHLLVANYVEKRDALLDEILPPEPDQEVEEFDMMWLGEFMDRLSEFDREMNQVVIDSNILAGVQQGELKEVGKTKVELRDGCLHVLKHAVELGIPVAVVSVNWSAEMVLGALSQEELPLVLAGGPGGGGQGAENPIPTPGAVAVYANELEYVKGISTGSIVRRCECAADKSRIFDDLALGVAAEGSFDPDGVLIYVGDSMTDLPALISADIGIIMGKNKLIRQVGSVAGVVIDSLLTRTVEGEVAFHSDGIGADAESSEHIVDERIGKGESITVDAVSPEKAAENSREGHKVELARAEEESRSPTLYQTFSWSEIDAFLFGGLFTAPSSAVISNKKTTNNLFRSSIPPQGSNRVMISSDEVKHLSLSDGQSFPEPPCVLSIAGSDSGGGAGIQADIKTCAALGCFATTAVTALTAQNTFGIDSVHVPPNDFLRRQLRSILGDIGCNTIKTGMLPNAKAVVSVAETVTELNDEVPLVVDPVLVSTSGDKLADESVVDAMLTTLFPLATLVTPNLQEASVLLGDREITDVESIKQAAKDLYEFGPRFVLVKGGHLPIERNKVFSEDEHSQRRWKGDAAHSTCVGPRQKSRAFIVDVLYDGHETIEMQSPLIETQNAHGTGCTLSTAIACYLARGLPVPAAVQSARRYVWRALERSAGLPLGGGEQKPMNHAYRTFDWWEGNVGQYADAIGVSDAKLLLDEISFPRRRCLMTSSSSGRVASAKNMSVPATRHQRIANDIDVRLYAVTDSGMIARNGISLHDAVMLAVDGGATVVQIREKDCDAREFAERAAIAVNVCRQRGVPLIINDRVDVAAAVGAHGVHVGQDDLPVKAVRRIMGQDAIVGVSVKTVEQALHAEADGADYIGAGSIFETSTKIDSSVIGPKTLQEIKQNVSIPVVAIGGISFENASCVIDSGADGVAVVSAIFNAAEGPLKATLALRSMVDDALHRRGGFLPAEIPFH